MAFALKEWSSVCQALTTGQQIITLRKGGIEEEAGEFKPLHKTFYLYPTLEHQKVSALRPSFQKLIDAEMSLPAELRLTAFANCEESFVIRTDRLARQLSTFTVWTEEAIVNRLHLYPQKPLVLMILHVFRLRTPLVLPEDASYAGCRSWVPLVGAPEISLDQGSPVVEAARFQDQRAQLAALLSA